MPISDIIGKKVAVLTKSESSCGIVKDTLTLGNEMFIKVQKDEYTSADIFYINVRHIESIKIRY